MSDTTTVWTGPALANPRNEVTNVNADVHVIPHEPGKPRFRVLCETQNKSHPAEGWRLFLEITIDTATRSVDVNRICVAPDRDNGLPNPYALK